MSELITTTESKVTARQVRTDCPDLLKGLANRIEEELQKASKCEEEADQHYRTVGQHLLDARRACNAGGFKAFREKFFPELGKSRVYELLQIATDKKSVEEVRASTQERVARHRANKASSVTVTEKPEEWADPQDIPISVVEHTVAPPIPASEGTKPRRAVDPGDESVSNFTAVVMDLVRLTKNKQPAHFAKSAVPAHELTRVATLLTGLATLKSSASQAGSDGDVSCDQLADARDVDRTPDEEKAAA
jgi:hypothetical protein